MAGGDSRLSARFGSDTTDFKDGIREINRELKVIESGFRASASALGEWSDSATGLEMRIKALNDQIELQTEKCEALRYRYEELKAAHGENSVEAQNAQIALNKETETLNKMQVELEQTTDALQEMGSQAETTGDQVKGSGSKFEGLGKIVGSVRDIIKNTSVIVAGVGVAVKKALDFGAEGAKLAQVRESYSGFIQRLQVSTDVLERLSEAARQTIDDDDLMAASLKMVTGASDEMSRTLLENAPALMEIAKASNKLNPTMGSTLDLFESISESIKNLTPRGLKQAGIVIDTAAAYEKYAQSIGKTRDALTEEEQSMALMNAVLEKGQIILQQVGGNTASATDRFERANVAIDNLKDTIHDELLPVLGDAATGLSTVLGASDTTQITTAWGDFFNTMIQEGKSSTEILEAYRLKSQEVNKVFNEQSNVIDKAAVGWIKLTQDEGKFLSDQQGLRQALLKTSRTFDEYFKAIVIANGGTAEAAEKSNFFTDAIREQAQAEWDAVYPVTELTQEMGTYTDSVTMAYQEQERLTQANLDTVNALEAEKRAALEAASAIQSELSGAVKSLQQAQESWSLSVASSAISAIESTQGLSEEQIRILKAATDSVMGSTYTATDEMNAALAQAVADFAETGDVSQYQEDIQAIADDFETTLAPDIKVAQDAVDNLQHALDLLNDKPINVPVHVIVDYPKGGIPGTGGTVSTPGSGGGRDKKPAEELAGGGWGVVPPGYPNDTYPVGLTSGEEYLVTPPGGPGISETLARIQRSFNMLAGSIQTVQSNTTIYGDSRTAAMQMQPARAPINIAIQGAPDGELKLRRLARYVAAEIQRGQR